VADKKPKAWAEKSLQKAPEKNTGYFSWRTILGLVIIAK
jgi:hypothetical protein